MSFGARDNAASASVILSVVVLITRHFLSSNSLSVCTCGSMSLPFGAWISCGMTRSTRSVSQTRSPSINSWPKSSGKRRVSAEITASIPLPFNALTATTSKLLSAFLPITALFSSKTQFFAASIAALSSFPLLFSCASAESKISSILFKANTTGVCFFAKSRLHSASSLKAFLNGIPAFFAAMTSAISSTTTAISVFSAAR